MLASYATVSISFFGEGVSELCYLANVIILGSLEKDDEIMFIFERLYEWHKHESGECHGDL